MSLEQVLVIAFGIIAIIDIHLLRHVKRLNEGFNLLIEQTQNNTAMLLHLKHKFNISEEECMAAIKEFRELVDNYEDTE